MDSPKPFVVRGLEVKDEPVDDQECNLSLQLSLSYYYTSKNTAAVENKGKEKVSYSERKSEVVVGEEIKSRSLSSETTHLSLGLGLSFSGDSTIMSEEKKETITFLEEGFCSDQYQRENNVQILNPTAFGGLSLQLSLGPSDACCSTSKKRSTESIIGVSSCRNKKTRVAREEQMMTELRLGRPGDDPWRIKKELKESDLGNNSRLLLAAELVNSHVFPFWNAYRLAKVEEGLPVFVWDCDTGTEHDMVFKQWNKGGTNVLIKNWVPEFVKRRELKKGDQIGLYWDERASRFNFSVLNRAAAGH